MLRKAFSSVAGLLIGLCLAATASRGAAGAPSSTAHASYRPARTQVDIGGQGPGFVLKDWPEPDRPVAVPWRRIALNFDEVAFTGIANALGDDPFRWTAVQKWNFPQGSGGFGLDTYFVYDGSRGPTVSEGIVTIGALVGGTFVGLDYARKTIPGNPDPINLVRLTKKYFASSTGANVFLNNIPSAGGGAFWYDVYPNVLACQLAAQYGKNAELGAPAGEPTLDSLCLESVDTWSRVTDHLRAGHELPEFAYQAVQLVAGKAIDRTSPAAQFQPLQLCGPKVWDPHITVQPNPGMICLRRDTPYTQYQSEAAAGIGYLAFMALEQTGDSKYRQLTDWTFGFLDSVTYNPTYEVLVPYGAVAAARMNAEYATRYDLARYLDWIFSESSVRFFWSMLGGSWGGYPVFGLVGQPNHTVVYARQVKGNPVQGSAASQDTLATAVTLAPIARYQPQFARALGKYLGHVATNARLFYPAYVPYGDATTKAYLTRAADPLLNASLPYEAIYSFSPGRILNEPFATGDAVKSGIYKTNLAVYGGVLAGGMAALFNPTNVGGIYQIDLLATDLPRPKAFPTYLFYNPYGSSRCVRVDSERARDAEPRLRRRPLAFYDLVARATAPVGACAQQSLLLAPGQAAVITVVPGDETLSVEAGRLVAPGEGIVVDFQPGG